MFLFFSILVISIVLFFLVAVIFFLCTFFMLVDYEKSSPFECGFQPFSLGGFPFSLPFFMISLVFLLFDVEIILVSFYPLVYFSNIGLGVITFFLLFLILFSTVYEWFKGILSWF